VPRKRESRGERQERRDAIQTLSRLLGRVSNTEEEIKDLKKDQVAARKKEQVANRRDAKERQRRREVPGFAARARDKFSGIASGARTAIRSGAAIPAAIVGLIETGIRLETARIRDEDFAEKKLINAAGRIVKLLPFVAALDERIIARLEKSNAQLIDRILSDEIINNIGARLSQSEAFRMAAAEVAAKQFSRTDQGRRIRAISGRPRGTP